MTRTVSGIRIPLASRRGFTLIELLVVILIIIILISLIIPAVGAAKYNAQVAQVKAEINAIDTAIVSFKTKFGGVDLPSRIVLQPAEMAGTPTPGSTWDNESKAIILQLWPQFDFTNGGQPFIWTGTKLLDGAECLVFFLGGVNDGTGTPTDPSRNLIGFAKNPARPFDHTASLRDAPFYQFASNRLVDLDGDKTWEYVDSFPGQEKPLLYFSAGDTGRYSTDYSASEWWCTDNWEQPGTIYPTPLTATQRLKYCYFTSINGTATTASANATAATTSVPANPKGYQIISPGIDKEYGVGGLFKPGDSSILNNFDFDNVTNFSRGLMGRE